MNMINFEDCIENRIHYIRGVLSTKAKEYATDTNRFHNFDAAARILNCTPERALQGIAVKHAVSVLDLIEWADSNTDLLTEAIVNEKIGNTINYLILLEGLLLRRIETKSRK